MDGVDVVSMRGNDFWTFAGIAVNSFKNWLSLTAKILSVADSGEAVFRPPCAFCAGDLGVVRRGAHCAVCPPVGPSGAVLL